MIQPPRRAHGGPVEGGRSYMVGEKGPELFTPRSGGQITANDKMGGAGFHIENFNLQAYSDRFSLRQVRDELAFSGGI